LIFIRLSIPDRYAILLNNSEFRNPRFSERHTLHGVSMQIFTCLIHFLADLGKTRMVYEIYIKICLGMVSIIKIGAARAAIYVRA